MAFYIRGLPDILQKNSLSDESRPSLPCTTPLFSLKKLFDKPADPILDHILYASRNLPQWHIEELVGLTKIKKPKIESAALSNTNSDAKSDLDVYTPVPMNNLLTWDSMARTPSRSTLVFTSPFLSERPSLTLAAARSRLAPSLADTGINQNWASFEHFLQALSMNIYGNSSSLYLWDDMTHELVLTRDISFTEGVIFVEGSNPNSLSKLVIRILNIGKYFRRIQGLVSILRASSLGPTSSSFAHGLTEILEYLRTKQLALPPLQSPNHLATVWYHYEEPEAILECIASLCQLNGTPPYKPINFQRAELAELIYDHLQQLYCSNSQPASRKYVAYLLSIVSIDIFRGISQSIGLVQILSSERKHIDSLGQGSTTEDKHNTLPGFIPTSIVMQIDKAARSLSLLLATRPEHPLCHPLPAWKELCVGWEWTDSDVEYRLDTNEKHLAQISESINEWRWNMTSPKCSTTCLDLPIEVPTRVTSSSLSTGPELAAFRVFDLEPGTTGPQDPRDPSLGESPQNGTNIDSFVSMFPDHLPLFAPTLQTLLDTVALQPLLKHAQLLSTSLLDLVLSDLDLIGHLELLHRFVLFGDPAFASRVRKALFTDSPELDHGGLLYSRAHNRRRSTSSTRRRDAATYQGWGAGLNPALSDRGAWPPAGSDLAFSLRRVIVDALDDGRVETDDGERRTGEGKQRDIIWKEAEWRLGFIIRPFDAEEEADGNPAWADPSSIQALDFLEMDYKPPPSITTLLPRTTMDQYRRVFAFLIRLLRVDSVARMLFQCTRSEPMFARVSAERMFYRFSFQANAFMRVLSTYINDVAIGANHAAFVQRLTKLRHGVQEHLEHDDVQETALEDVFSIVDYHSTVLDRILEACFLKTRHKGVGGISLFECMDTILRMGKLVNDIKDQKVGDDNAETKLIRLIDRFGKCVENLIAGLKILDESGQVRRMQINDDALDGVQGSANSDLRLLLRGDSRRSESLGLSNLLLRLDASGWHSRRQDGPYDR